MEAVIKSCKACGADIPENPGYVTWCDKCGWNMDPYKRETKKKTLEKFYEYMGKRWSKGLYESVLKNIESDQKITVSKVLSFVFAALIYLANIFIVLLFVYKGISLIRQDFSERGIILGVFCLGLALIFVPKFKWHKIKTIDREEFPVLYGIIDKIADAMGTPRVYRLSLNTDFNASFTKVGRDKSIITLGLPLFNILSGEEKVALIAHELAHGANNDIRRGKFVGRALILLENWYMLVAPFSMFDESDVFFLLKVVNFFKWCISRVIAAIWYLLSFLIWWNSQRAEYLADYLASTVCGTDAAVRLLEKLHFSYSFDIVLERAARHGYVKNIYREMKSFIDNIPPREAERVKRILEQESCCVDTTHPPTTYRMSFLKENYQASKLELGKDELQKLDEELNDVQFRFQEILIDDYKRYIA